MQETELRRIESTLLVTLPAAYREFLIIERTDTEIDEASVLDDADAIINATREYRAGFAGLKPWPSGLVYVGDEADACPYLIDCASGRVSRTDKGNLDRRSLAEYESFAEFLKQLRSSARNTNGSASKHMNLYYYLPLVAGMLVIFVVLPAIAFGVTQAFKWFTN